MDAGFNGLLVNYVNRKVSTRRGHGQRGRWHVLFVENTFSTKLEKGSESVNLGEGGWVVCYFYSFVLFH